MLDTASHDASAFDARNSLSAYFCWSLEFGRLHWPELGITCWLLGPLRIVRTTADLDPA